LWSKEAGMSTMETAQFKKALLALLDEAFDEVHGYFLDKHNSLFETLAGITAEEASIPVGGRCATLAAYHLGEIRQALCTLKG
jgi:hypothetical protein